VSKEESRSKMSEAEREKRRSAIGKAASEKVAKTEQINFRIEEHFITELQEVAYRYGIPVGTMIREWVLERLSEEKLGTDKSTSKALYLLNDMRGKLNTLFSHLPQATTDNQKEHAKTSQAWLENAHLCFTLPISRNTFATHLVNEEAANNYCGTTPCKPEDELASGSNSHELEHLRAIEHLLKDQLNAIRSKLKESEAENGA
jgi:predicted DNA binding CopG/RHH family protein